MDPFAAAEPNSNAPAPPPYLSQVEYDEKIADVLQRSLVLEDLNDRRPTSRQRWSTNSPLQQAARQSPRPVVPLPSPPGTANTADSRGSVLGRASSSSSHHRQNSISSSSNGTTSSYGSSRHSKERPAWYNEAGLGGRGSGRLFVSSPATMSNGTSASGPSSQPVSPVDDTGYPRRYFPSVLDEEAGIDNPPPSFQAALTAPTPGSLSPARSARSSYDTVTSSSGHPNATSPRTSYDGAAPRLTAPQYQPHVGQRGTYPTAPSSVPGSPPQVRRRRGSSAASSSYGVAVGGFAASLSGSGPVPITTNGNGPQLVVDKALAYGKTSNPGLPQGAAAPAATAFYGSAVSAALRSQAAGAAASALPSSGSSSTYTTYPSSSSSSRPVSQRDSTVSINSPNSYVSPSAPNSTSSTYNQGDPWRPPSAQSFMTNSSAPAGRASLGDRRASRESMVTTFSAPAFGSRERTHGRSSSTAYAGSQMTAMTLSRPASSNDQRASYPPYPSSSSSPITRPPPPTDEFNPFAATGVTVTPTPVSQQRQSHSGYYPGVVSDDPSTVVASAGMSGSSNASTTRWVPPGAARPANVYERRFG